MPRLNRKKYICTSCKTEVHKTFQKGICRDCLEQEFQKLNVRAIHLSLEIKRESIHQNNLIAQGA